VLYNPQLETFLHVADAGSFNRAAAESFITPTAVKKQITRLENDVGAVLFFRTHLGLSLTPAGKSLYISAKRLIQFSKDAVSQAQREAEPTENIIRIGISPMTPADRIFAFWPKISKACPDCKIQLVPYENSLESAQRTLGNLGTNIDVIAGVFDEELLAARHCEGLPLFEEPICAAVSQSHSLASRNRLRVEDLYGQKLLLIQHGWCRSVDHMREELRKKHPQIEIVDFNFFNVDIFNRCQNSGDVLMAVENWANVHPLLKMLPVDWPYTLQFGIFHAPKPSNYVQRFLNALEEAEKA
jgi:DNA-binding transcriptional LysR family regulator